MTLGRFHRWSLVGTLTLAILAILGGSSLLLGAGVVIIGVLLLQLPHLHRLEHSPTRTWLTHGLTVAGLVFAVSIFRSARVDSVLIVVMLGIFNRYVLRSGQRDDLILVGASVILLVMGTTITPGIGFLGIVLLFIPAALWTAWASMLLGLSERAATLGERLQQQSILSRRPLPRQRATLAFLGLAFTTGGYLLASLLPRHQLAQFLSPGYLMGLPGAAAAMELTAGGVSAQQDATVILRVEPKEPGALMEGLYARMYVLDQFDGRRWSTDMKSSRTPLLPRRARPTGDESEFEASDPKTVAKLALRRQVPRGHPHPLVTVGRDRPAAVMVRHAEQLMGGTWFHRGNQGALGLDYKIDLAQEAQIEPLPPVLRAKAESNAVALPDDLDPRLGQLAAQLVLGATTDEEKVRRVLAHFDRGYEYSTEAVPGTDADPLLRFLFEGKKGHCELYAGAVAVLLRLAGVGANVVTGYYGGWWNSRGNYLEFTAEDAHAWVELKDKDGRLRWVDATPESIRARRNGKSWAWIMDIYEVVQGFWFDRVVDFDEAKRRRLMGNLGEGFWSMLGEGGEDSPKSRPIVVSGGLALVGLVVVLAAVGFWWRRRDPEVLGLRLRKALGDKGPSVQPLGLLLAAAPAARQAAGREAVRLYEAMRFGPSSSAPSPQQVAQAVAALERAK